jgi:competence protein ComEA
MSFYRTMLAAVAAIAIASPVFADDATTTTDTNGAAATTQTTTTTTTETTAQKVNVNTATAKDLMNITVDGKKLGAGKAKSIIAYRKKHGNFTTTDDLANVKGLKKMNPTTLKALTDQLSVE